MGLLLVQAPTLPLTSNIVAVSSSDCGTFGAQSQLPCNGRGIFKGEAKVCSFGGKDKDKAIPVVATMWADFSAQDHFAFDEQCLGAVNHFDALSDISRETS